MTYKEFRQRYQYNEAEHSLGEGSFGNVYWAIDTETKTGETVALKIAKQIQIQDEAKLIKDKKDYSPYIANYKESGTFSDIKKDYIVMQYYKDGDLSKRQNELSLTEKEFVLEKILEGIKYLHQNNIIHRDLKPNNILISIENGKYIPKISDFGISKSVSGHDGIMRNSIEGGTLGYASPEQMNSDVIDFNYDLWSFGVIAFEVLSGHFPFRYDDINLNLESGRDIFKNRICKAEYQEQYLADIPEPWQKLICRCLISDFNNRIKTVDECLAVLTGKEEKFVWEEPELIDEIIDDSNNDVNNSQIWYKIIMAGVVVILLLLLVSWLFTKLPPSFEEVVLQEASNSSVSSTVTQTPKQQSSSVATTTERKNLQSSSTVEPEALKDEELSKHPKTEEVALKEEYLTKLPPPVIQTTPTTTQQLSVGMHYQGGIIAYIDATGKHGLIAAPKDQSTGIKWDNGDIIIETGATGTAIGTGKSNTKKIVQAQGQGNYAAKLCYDLSLNGYSDWYLPSKNELNILYKNRELIGGFFIDCDNCYWSSSETKYGNARGQDFNNGRLYGSTGKNYTGRVRAVRAF